VLECVWQEGTLIFRLLCCIVPSISLPVINGQQFEFKYSYNNQREERSKQPSPTTKLLLGSQPAKKPTEQYNKDENEIQSKSLPAPRTPTPTPTKQKGSFEEIVVGSAGKEFILTLTNPDQEKLIVERIKQLGITDVQVIGKCIVVQTVMDLDATCFAGFDIVVEVEEQVLEDNE